MIVDEVVGGAGGGAGVGGDGALRVVQTLRNSATPSNTTFGLRRSYNCFWITL